MLYLCTNKIETRIINNKKKSDMEFQNNNVIVLRNGAIGYVASFNGKPSMLIFKNYTNTVGVYNGDLKKGGNANYDVMSVYDGTSVENPKDIYKKSFKVEELPKVWERSE